MWWYLPVILALGRRIIQRERKRRKRERETGADFFTPGMRDKLLFEKWYHFLRPILSYKCIFKTTNIFKGHVQHKIKANKKKWNS